MATFVLIHGMWHGAWCWKKVTPLLHAAGHEVHTVTLTGVGERAHLHYPDIDLHTHIQDVVSVLDSEDLHNVILVGHSLAGFMTRGVAERVPERVAQIISLDGRIPDNGEPFKTVWPDIWTELCQRAYANGDDEWSAPDSERTFGVTGADIEWMMSKLPPHPLKTWETPLSFTNPAARSIGERQHSRFGRALRVQNVGEVHQKTVVGECHAGRQLATTEELEALEQSMNLEEWDATIDEIVGEVSQAPQYSSCRKVLLARRAKLEAETPSLESFQIDEILGEAVKRLTDSRR